MPPFQVTLEERIRHLSLIDRRGKLGDELYHLTESAINRESLRVYPGLATAIPIATQIERSKPATASSALAECRSVVTRVRRRSDLSRQVEGSPPILSTEVIESFSSDFARSTGKGRFSLYSIVFDRIRVKFQTQPMFVRIGGPSAVLRLIE